MTDVNPFGWPPGCVLCGIEDCTCLDSHTCEGCHTRWWMYVSRWEKPEVALQIRSANLEGAPVCESCWCSYGLFGVIWNDRDYTSIIGAYRAKKGKAGLNRYTAFATEFTESDPLDGLTDP